jgi:hypothetical protein
MRPSWVTRAVACAADAAAAAGKLAPKGSAPTHDE